MRPSTSALAALSKDSGIPTLGVVYNNKTVEPGIYIPKAGKP
jgi:hypothetical protein